MEFMYRKVLYVYCVDYVHFMLIVYIIMFMCIMYPWHIRLIVMSVLQVMHIMYFRDIPNIHNAFIIHKAFP